MRGIGRIEGVDYTPAAGHFNPAGAAHRAATWPVDKRSANLDRGARSSGEKEKDEEPYGFAAQGSKKKFPQRSGNHKDAGDKEKQSKAKQHAASERAGSL
jgi:hypothetical protein